MNNIKTLLESGLINLSALGRLMFPNSKQPGQYLYKKLNNRERQSFTPEDRKKVEIILKKYLTDND